MNTARLLTSTNDKTDRAAEIEALLQAEGCCTLGSGVFYVSGITMPQSTTLMGMGAATRLILLPELEEGFAVRLTSYCTIKDLAIDGAEEEIPCPDTIGNRHGLLFKSNATTEKWEDDPRNATVSNCVIRCFSGGGITCTDTGYSLRCIMAVSNCHILGCGAGINITRLSEYHDFSNVICTNNLYGCINNGGNNTFSACSFSANKVGFMIDNEGEKSPNNSHGTVVGCTFNHCGNNEGIAILLHSVSHGFVFTGCQIFYGKIVIKDSVNVVFNALNMGRKTSIDVTGGGLVMFNCCALRKATDTAITVTQNNAVKLIHCYTREGEPITL